MQTTNLVYREENKTVLINILIMRFKNWILKEASMDANKTKQLQDIWKDTFTALVGKIDTKNAINVSFSDINYSSNSNDAQSNFKGKQAVLKSLENGQIFNRLQKLNDPEIEQRIQDVKAWLGKDSKSNSDTTIGNLLEKLFPSDFFDKNIGSDFPKSDNAKAKVPPQPPKQDLTGPNAPAPDNQNMPPQPPSQPGPPMSGMMGEQPPMNQNMGNPAMPMPPKPAGAELGLF